MHPKSDWQIFDDWVTLTKMSNLKNAEESDKHAVLKINSFF